MEITKNKVHDQLSDGAELLVFNEGKIFRLEGIAPLVWDILEDKNSLEEITQKIVETIGEPPQGNAQELVEQAVKTLEEENLVTLS